jgi:hypothetical protein
MLSMRIDIICINQLSLNVNVEFSSHNMWSRMVYVPGGGSSKVSSRESAFFNFLGLNRYSP